MSTTQLDAASATTRAAVALQMHLSVRPSLDASAAAVASWDRRLLTLRARFRVARDAEAYLEATARMEEDRVFGRSGR